MTASINTQPNHSSQSDIKGKKRNKGMKHAKKKKHGGHQKFKKTVVDLDTMIESGRATVVDDVNRLIDALNNGVPIEELRTEILRLHHVIVDGHLQDVVIQECGKNNLLSVLKKARKLRGTAVKQNKPMSPGVNTDRHKWLKWFRGVYGFNGKSSMSEEIYDAIQIAASSVDFTEILTNSKTADQFHQNGLAECYSLAKRENFYREPPKKRSPKPYVSKSSPQVTRKDWGSIFRPARG